VQTGDEMRELGVYYRASLGVKNGCLGSHKGHF
jgi:hypothetical protein